MKNQLLILALFGSHVLYGSPAMADTEEFVAMCEQREELPAAQQVTMNSLVKIGSGLFSGVTLPCAEVARNLRQTDFLDMQGQTFAYIDTEDLTPLQTLTWLKGLNIANQMATTSLTPLESLDLETINVMGTSIGLEQVARLTGLRNVYFDVTPATDLSVLRALPKLELVRVSPQLPGAEGSIDLSALGQTTVSALTLDVFPNGTANARFTGLSAISTLRKIMAVQVTLEGSELGQLPLTSLRVYRGQLLEHENIAGITTLEELALTYHKLDSAEFVRNLTALKDLDLSNNEIVSLDPLSDKVKLEKLNLRANHIWSDRPIRGLSEMRHLNLSSNRMGVGADITAMTKLEYLDLSRNQSHSIGTRLDVVYPHLKTIRAEHNRLRSSALRLFDPESFPALEEFNLGYNKLVNVAPLGKLTTLKILVLDDNKISDVSTLAGLSNLARLSARMNLLRDLTCPLANEEVCDFLHQEH